LNIEYMKCKVYVHMNYLSVNNTKNAKYTCDMMVNKTGENVTSINGQ